jgi:hypothetical protein
MPDQRQRQQRDDRRALSASPSYSTNYTTISVDNFLPSWRGIWYSFSEVSTSRVRIFHRRGATTLSALGAGNGSQTAPQLN